MSLIPTPAWTEDRMTQFFDTAMNAALSHGLTSIHDALSLPRHIAFFKKFVHPFICWAMFSFCKEKPKRVDYQ